MDIHDGLSGGPPCARWSHGVRVKRSVSMRVMQWHCVVLCIVLHAFDQTPRYGKISLLKLDNYFILFLNGDTLSIACLAKLCPHHELHQISPSSPVA